MEGNVRWANTGDVAVVVEQVEHWLGAGASYLGVSTMGAGLTSVEQHLAVLADVAEALHLASA
jgi:hypothetical protein